MTVPTSTSSPPPPPPQAQPHAHTKFVVVIAALAILAIIIGGGLASSASSNSNLQSQVSNLSSDKSQLSNQNQQLQSQVTSLQLQIQQLQSEVQPRFTYVHGTVDVGSGRTADSIFFDNQQTGTLASPIFVDDTYQLYLVTGKTYGVTLYYTTTFSGLQSCTGRPGVFTPTGSDYTQIFFC